MSRSKLHIAIVVLADKENLELGKAHYNLGWGNSTVLGHTIKEIVKTQINDLYVVLGSDYEEIFNRHKHFPVRFIKNSNWENRESLELEWIISQMNLEDVDGILFLNSLQPELDNGHIKEVIQTFKEQEKVTIATAYPDKFSLPALFNMTLMQQIKKRKPACWDNVFKPILAQVTPVKPKTELYTITNLPQYLVKHNDWFGEVNPI